MVTRRVAATTTESDVITRARSVRIKTSERLGMSGAFEMNEVFETIAISEMIAAITEIIGGIGTIMDLPGRLNTQSRTFH